MVLDPCVGQSLDKLADQHPVGVGVVCLRWVGPAEQCPHSVVPALESLVTALPGLVEVLNGDVRLRCWEEPCLVEGAEVVDVEDVWSRLARYLWQGQWVDVDAGVARRIREYACSPVL